MCPWKKPEGRNGGEVVVVVVKIETLERSEVGKGRERSRERELPWREGGEFGESAEIGRKSLCERLRN